MRWPYLAERTPIRLQSRHKSLGTRHPVEVVNLEKHVGVGAGRFAVLDLGMTYAEEYKCWTPVRVFVFSKLVNV
jgi:hypothetical protein